MLIQCHACNTKYRLNLEQIPRRKTFVRCKSCGTPIYIDPTEDEAPVAGVIPPPPGTRPPVDTQPPVGTQPAVVGAGPVLAVALEPGQVQVSCPSCASRYRIAGHSLQRPGVKLKCSQCGHLFVPAQAAQHAAAPHAGAQHVGVQPAAARQGAGASGGREMPLPDEAHMEGLFDDLRPGAAGAGGEAELGSLPDAGFAEEPPAPDGERAYQEAVAFDDGDEPASAAGRLPDDQKHQFFLNPKDYQGSDSGMADDPAEKGPFGADAPGQAEPGAVRQAEPGPGEKDLPPLPMKAPAQDRDEMSGVREVVPGQEVQVFTEKRVMFIVAAAAVMILVGTGAWGYWLAATADDRRAYSVQSGQPHQLALQESLQGRYLTNGPSGNRLFVVNGEVENRFPGSATVRWIRIKGLAYTDQGQSELLGSTFAYAGNVLDDQQLAEWELPAVKAYYGFTNGRKELNLSIPAGAKVPYQLVFSGISGEVGRAIAQIVSYHRDGQAVFVDNP